MDLCGLPTGGHSRFANRDDSSDKDVEHDVGSPERGMNRTLQRMDEDEEKDVKGPNFARKSIEYFRTVARIGHRRPVATDAEQDIEPFPQLSEISPQCEPAAALVSERDNQQEPGPEREPEEPKSRYGTMKLKVKAAAYRLTGSRQGPSTPSRAVTPSEHDQARPATQPQLGADSRPLAANEEPRRHSTEPLLQQSRPQGGRESASTEELDPESLIVERDLSAANTSKGKAPLRDRFAHLSSKFTETVGKAKKTTDSDAADDDPFTTNRDRRDRHSLLMYQPGLPAGRGRPQPARAPRKLRKDREKFASLRGGCGVAEGWDEAHARFSYDKPSERILIDATVPGVYKIERPGSPPAKTEGFIKAPTPKFSKPRVVEIAGSKSTKDGPSPMMKNPEDPFVHPEDESMKASETTGEPVKETAAAEDANRTPSPPPVPPKSMSELFNASEKENEKPSQGVVIKVTKEPPVQAGLEIAESGASDNQQTNGDSLELKSETSLPPPVPPKSSLRALGISEKDIKPSRSAIPLAKRSHQFAQPLASKISRSLPIGRFTGKDKPLPPLPNRPRTPSTPYLDESTVHFEELECDFPDADKKDVEA